MNDTLHTDVLICGGGPCGLMMALELGRRGIRTVLVDAKAGTAFNPQANATQARTMEHFRRLGFANEVRAMGLPGDHPTDIAYFTRFHGHELARLRLPTAKEAVEAIERMSGSWSAAELPHRISQKYVEAALLKQVEAHPSVDVRFQHHMSAFEETTNGIVAQVSDKAHAKQLQIQAQYLFAADGARSPVRHTLGISWEGETGKRRAFMGGKMFAVYFRCPAFYERLQHDRAWMYVAVNAERRALLATVDGQGEFALHAAIHEDEDAETWDFDKAKTVIAQAMGETLPVDILSAGTWLAGHALYAQRFQRGRVFLGGDAAHLFTPTGGLGYNTAVEDAINLAWKLAHVIQGHAHARLLDSYEEERKPLAMRNTGYARHFADSVGLFVATPLLEAQGPQAEAERARASEHLNAHVRMEFNIPGITLGGRYDGSSAIVSDGSTPPPDSANTYVPTACPGGRPPHAWLAKGDSLYDHFGQEWTLLVLGPDEQPVTEWTQQAQKLGVSLKVLRLNAQDLLTAYEAPLVLIRPDHIVAWRGQASAAVQPVWDQLLGFSPV